MSYNILHISSFFALSYTLVAVKGHAPVIRYMQAQHALLCRKHACAHICGLWNVELGNQKLCPNKTEFRMSWSSG